MKMTITQNNENGIITLLLEGWLDHQNAPLLGKCVDAIDEAKGIVLDFTKVEYISSAGIRQLVASYRKAKELQAEFSVVHVNPEVMSILAMTGLDKKMAVSGD